MAAYEIVIRAFPYGPNQSKTAYKGEVIDLYGADLERAVRYGAIDPEEPLPSPPEEETYSSVYRRGSDGILQYFDKDDNDWTSLPFVTNETLNSAVAAAPALVNKATLAHDLGGTADLPLIRPSNRMIMSKDLAIGQTPAVQAGITFPARTNGLSTSTMPAAAAALLATATGTSVTTSDITAKLPNFADPKSDTNYKIVGNFTYLFNSNLQQVGMFAIGRSDSNPEGGFTGGYGTISYKFHGRYLVRRMRGVGISQKLQLTVAKDGGPFKVHRDLADAQFGQEIIADPSGDGLYFLQLIDLGSVADWQIREETDSATFGGYYHLNTDTISYPDWRIPVVFLSGDSFSVPGQGQYVATLGFVSQFARMIGAEVHLSGCGGTGFRAKSGTFDGNGNPIQGTLLNYLERLPYDFARYFNDTIQPDLIIGLGSQNDRSFGFTGTTALTNNIRDWIEYMRAVCPDKPIVVTGLMHTRTETWNADYETINGQLLTQVNANPRWGVRYVRSLLQDGIAYGTGYQGATNGTGPSDYLTYTDSSHPSGGPGGGSGAIATQIFNYLKTFFPLVQRTKVGMTTAASVSIDASQVVSGKLPATRVADDLVSRGRLLRKWSTRIDGTNHPGGGTNYYVPGVDGGAAVALGAAGSAAQAWYFDPADPLVAVAGKSTKFYMRCYAQVGGVAMNSGFSVILIETNVATGSTAGQGLAATQLATVTGSTAADFQPGVTTAGARLKPSDSNTVPGDFLLSGAKWVIPRIAPYSSGFAATSVVELTIELWMKNA